MPELGILVGIITLPTIGLGFLVVILIERWLGWLWWPYLLGLGVFLVIGSMFIENDWCSAWLGVGGATLAWGATELKKQARRAELGWFPYNPNKIQPPFKEKIGRWKAPSL
ncbi:MAG: DUF4491 family protein [Anaerolineales bacterium]|nr:DUF4491 family protein [Anaerolineales bacterium]MCS7246623.1 DUF4491 family protein [Anaerolineales bacterium]MDW8160433.1 DUF4491 family protein [Anaerolineales bacterium]MDW8447784.1 DUF4491 family protein [Anaerolineales bacterium]